ncbi:MAG: fibronectin type III domain-containing protein [bacterium]
MTLCLAIAALLTGTLAPDLPVPTGLVAHDRPGDGGGVIILTWDPPPEAAAAEGQLPGFTGYEVWREAEGDTWQRAGFVGPLARRYRDDVTDGARYRYRLAVLHEAGTAEVGPTEWVESRPHWFDPGTLVALIGTFVFSFLVLFFTDQARRGRKMFVRRIAGLDAVEEALGRATEMGRPILFVPGLSTVDDIATIAALNILSEVAKKTAGFGTPLICPTADPIVYTVAREMVKEAYTTVGRPDSFNPDSVYFVTNTQFAFAAAVDGIMVREKPATNFLIGMFWAESLIMAETGASTGAIQIAGTDALAQLPFFIAACDYTLIGEELYAASAYISREPLLMGAIKGQDYGKFIIGASIVVITLLELLFGIPAARIL